MKKGSYKWFMNLSDEHKLEVFKRWSDAPPIY